jgi:hypothetical protein
MDTDYLSVNTYNAVIITAEKFDHNLTLQFGCAAYECRNEEEYLEEIEGLIKYWLEDEDVDEIMEDIFFGEAPEKEAFFHVLNQILINIENVRKIPENKREYDY